MTRTIIDDGSIAAVIAPDGVSGHVTENPDDHPMYPLESEFSATLEYKGAPELKEIVDDLIRLHQKEFGFLEVLDVEIIVLWKGKGGKSRGKLVCGKCVKLTGLARWFGRAQYVIWVAADAARDFRWTNLQLEALLYHELLHIKPVIDDNIKSVTYGELIGTAVRGHDDEIFVNELLRYGAWNHQHKAVAEAARTMLLELPASNGASDDE